MKEIKKVSIVGASGYTGAELFRLLANHPLAEVIEVTGHRTAGRRLNDVCPWLDTEMMITEFDPEITQADIVFLCLEAGLAGNLARTLVERGIRVIDLSADFRLTDIGLYERVYGRPHPILSEESAMAFGWHHDSVTPLRVIYSIPELVDRHRLRSANIVANPGCYPTASMLALAPLMQGELLAEGAIPVIDAKSGVSGAGRGKADTAYLFTEITGDFRAYAATGHRHVPEIEQSFGGRVRFTPHLIPQSRGIEATVHVPLKPGVGLSAVKHAFQAFANDYPFVRVVTSPPSTKQVLGSNRCDIYPTYDENTGYAVISSAIDNLVKGASGQAIQNMNLMLGWEETLGLSRHGVWP